MDTAREILDQVADATLHRLSELEETGLDFGQASRRAWLEQRIAHWPSGWGDDLYVLVYGDFEPLSDRLDVPALGISVLPGHVEDTVIGAARTVQQAIVAIPEKSISALIDAARRMNILLGVWTLQNFANATLKWWSWVTHDSQGKAQPILSIGVQEPALVFLGLPPVPGRKVHAALYWIREPQPLLREFPRSDLARQFSAFWNAFECLVEAINEVRPVRVMSPTEKAQAIAAFFEDLGHAPTPGDVQDCYLRIVNPGFVGKAKHALELCFGPDAAAWIDQCFTRSDKENRLYDIRNAINHGEIEAENPLEQTRLDARLTKLQELVLRMFSPVTREVAEATA